MGFQNDLNNAREAEWLVCRTLAQKDASWQFEWVGDNREDFHKGDIKAIDPYTGFSLYLEVKNDNRIADTGNILCEWKKYFYDSGEYRRGNIKNEYDYYCVVSQQDRRIYVLDGPTLRQWYQNGERKVIYHDTDITYCHLLPLSFIQKKGGLRYTITY